MKQIKSKTMKQVLIVDDDPDCLYIMKKHFEDIGFNVTVAQGEKEAEKYLSEHKPDLAVIDLMMEQDDSGFILSYKLKKRYPDVPVIIATAVTAETGHQFSLASENGRKWIKADFYMDKGIRRDQIEAEVRKLIKF